MILCTESNNYAYLQLALLIMLWGFDAFGVVYFSYASYMTRVEHSNGGFDKQTLFYLS